MGGPVPTFEDPARKRSVTKEASGEGIAGVSLPENAASPEQRLILDELPVLVFLERAGTVVFANAEARQLIGVAGEWTPRPLEEVLWGLLPGAAEPQTLLTGTQRGQPFHATLPAKDGRLHPVEGTYSVVHSIPREAIIVAHPGGRERAPRTRLMEDVLASIPEAVAIEHGGHLLYTNHAFSRMFGYSAEEAGGGSLRQLIVPETRLNEHVALLKGVDEKGRALVDTVRSTKSGELIDVSLQIAPLLVDATRAGYVYTFRDIGEHKATEAKLQHDAMHDVLTGLPNRALFLDRLTLALNRRLRRPDHSCGVLYLDLDRFKEINDALGHAAGDLLLQAVSERLTAVLRPQDSAARLGGDEFAVLVENILSVSDLEIVATRILRALDQPFDVYGHMLQTGSSIGAAMAGPDHTSADQLVRDADFAMYRAKQSGGSRLEVFDKHLEISATAQQERERELRRILDKRLFEFRYQPIFQLANGTLEGFESSLCWQRPDGLAGDFRELLAAAEETGLSISLGRETLEAVCTQQRMWRAALPHNQLFLSVNVTPRQFFHVEFVTQVRHALASTGADPSRLVLEIQESTLNQDPDAAVGILQRVVDCQVRVAIDEFGGSLAPLNHLVRLPIDMLKLDSKLTAAALTGGRQQAVLEALLRLARSLGMKAVAEGVETVEHLQALYRMGCVSGQGQMLSAPLEAVHALVLAQARLGGLAAHA